MDTQVDFQHEMKTEIDQASLLDYGNTERCSSECNEKQIEGQCFVSNTVKQEQINIKIENEEAYQFNTEEFNEKQIQDDDFDFKPVKPEKIEIKTENEEGDSFSIESSAVDSEKGVDPIDKAVHLSDCFWIEESSVFKCLKCSYQTHVKQNIKHHIICHTPKTLKCPLCPYKSNYKSCLKRHQLVHIPKEEAKWHSCPHCPYKTKRKHFLDDRHMKIHKPMHKCTLCPYESLEDCNLQTHQKHVHGLDMDYKKSDGVTWYQCPECSYKTQVKQYLKHHIQIHSDDRPVYKCTLCSYQALRKKSLDFHLNRVHNPLDLPSFSCPEKDCPFKTHKQSSLQRHIKIQHEYQEMFKCSECPFETKHIGSLQTHKFTQHGNPYKCLSCPLCPFKTTYKFYLSKHALVHKSDSEVEWFRCSECSYKTKRRPALRRHKLTHNSGAKKITDSVYCYVCMLRTSYKGTLARHIRRMHRDAKGRISGHL